MVRGAWKWVVGIIAVVWFRFVATAFWLRNAWRPRRTARRLTNPLLLQSASSLARRIRKREVSSVELVKALVDRINEVAYLNAVVLANFEATLEEAKAVDRRVASGNVPSAEVAPFLGVPFTLKDCIFVKGLRCTAGIAARGEMAAQAEDAVAVRNLRLAGAIGPLVVTNVSEVCMWWESSNGLFGRTHNAYDYRRIVGGSSGGEGCLMSAGGSIFGIGSDIGGSIRMPAFFNGIFGHKPSIDVISDHGMHPPTHGYQKTMLAMGPMCRYAEDLGPMLRALGGPAAESRLNFPPSMDMGAINIFYMEGLNSKLLSPLHPDMLEALHKVVKYMETRFESPCVRLDLPIVHKALPIYFNDLAQDGSPPFAEIMTDLHGKVNPYVEYVKMMRGQSRHTFAALLLCVFEDLTQHPKLKMGEDEKAKLVELREQLSKELSSVLGSNGVFLFPSHPTPAPFHFQPIAQPFNFVYTGLFNSLALPVTQVPVGLGSEGVPVGVQVVSGMHQDHVGIAVAAELERAFGGWTNFPRQ